MSGIVCNVYRSPKKAETYLYLDKQQGMECVPEALLASFGTPQLVFTLIMTPDKKLARVSGERVWQQLQTAGYFLQMPPPPDTEHQAIHQHNHKLPG